ncbi:serine/threonine phosphatase [Geotalea uraniireducens]|uniref:Serine/threonine phosphatase n=1 Tax=Geotalea uraniireducens TaxID=351604 RepID=A0ABM8ENW4_9BACT|nr:metallophosphoesterase [Geotalea uraniireducens]BDV44141.1 serine/threonine phosphatase [Geotalea uraniireducens]
MSLFLAMFFLIYGGTHVYFFYRARAAFGFGAVVAVALALFLAVMAVMPLLVRITERQGLEGIARFLAWSGYCWMGVLFFFFSSSLAIDSYHLVLKAVALLSHRDLAAFRLSPLGAFRLAALYTVVVTVYSAFEARDIRTEHLTVPSAKLPADVPRLRIVQISDVHLGLIVREELLQRIVTSVRAAGPDILVSTGDLVDGQINNLANLVEPLAELHPRFGKYAVTGNHEYYAGPEQAFAFTRRAGFRLLHGEAATVAGITVAGVDDPVAVRLGLAPADQERRLMATLPPERFTLLLKHRPQLDSPPSPFDLMLSGHVHGGQLFPFGLVVRLSYPLMNGVHRLANGALLAVSRGTGTWGPPLRFLAPPEITIIDLQRTP